MPFNDIQLIPGVNTVATPTLNKAGISSSNLIRFRGGLPEKIGGWMRYVATAMGSVTRALNAWQDLNSNKWLGVGSLLSLKVISNNSIQNITPQYLVTDPPMNISTTNGSDIITIVDTLILNVTRSDAVFFNTPIAIGGLILGGMYQINGGSGASYTITASGVATATALATGAVPTFTTTSGDSAVLVSFTGHGVSDGGEFFFPIATIVNGITVSGTYPVFGATTNTFQITGSNVATASGTVSMNGGLPQYLYYLAVGPSTVTPYGALGPIGQFAIGEGFAYTSTLNTQTGDDIVATDWSQDNWGEILLACPKGAPIFYWRPGSGFQTASPIGSGPPQNNFIFVSMPQQILVSLGSAASMVQRTNTSIDPLLIRWSDNIDFFEWRANTQTLAGSFKLSSGSKIVGGIQGAKSAIIFTDTDAWTMDYIGYPLVYGFDELSVGNGLIAPHAVATIRGDVFWMSNANFCRTSGNGASIIPCPIWDTVFQDLDQINLDKIVAGSNIDFNEVWFWYPSVSGGTGEPDKYVKFNTVEAVWDSGSMGRSAWVNRSVLGPPIGADPTTQYIQQHERGYDDDGVAMNSFYESGYAVIGDGQLFAIVDQFIPDMKYTTVNSSTPSATLTATLTTINWPSGGTTRSNVLTMTSTTPYLTPRLRGRQMKWRMESNDLGSWWRQGNPRYRYAPGGRV